MGRGPTARQGTGPQGRYVATSSQSFWANKWLEGPETVSHPHQSQKTLDVWKSDTNWNLRSNGWKVPRYRNVCSFEVLGKESLDCMLEPRMYASEHGNGESPQQNTFLQIDTHGHMVHYSSCSFSTGWHGQKTIPNNCLAVGLFQKLSKTCSFGWGSSWTTCLIRTTCPVKKKVWLRGGMSRK